MKYENSLIPWALISNIHASLNRRENRLKTTLILQMKIEKG